MNLSDLINTLASKHPNLYHKDVEACAKTILVAITNTLGKDKRVEIRGFGSFQNSKRNSYKARNPKSGEEFEVPPRLRPSFKAGKEFRKRVDYPK